jgi:N-acetylneuraminate synthase
MTAEHLQQFRSEIQRIEPLLGSNHKAPLPSEDPARLNARRSIVVARDLPAGHCISEADITYKRPGSGVSPLHWDEVIGRRTARTLAADDVLQWSDLS